MPETGERADALKILTDLTKVFPHNGDNVTGKQADEAMWRQVAVKKSKVNAFNDRDGI